MKSIIFSSLAMTLLTLTAAQAAPGRVFEFSANPWASSCDAQGCGIPKAAATAQTLKLFVANPTQPGQAGFTSQDLSFAIDSNTTLNAKIRWVATFPPTDLHLPKYDNIQIEISSPVHAVCAMTPRSNWGQLPPLVCASDSVPVDGKFTRTGITLISVSVQNRSSL